MPTKMLPVPTAARASLIGSRGKHVTDMMKSSGAVITFDTDTNNKAVTKAFIQGTETQIEKATAIIKISTIHAMAADQKAAGCPPNITEKDVAKFDFNTFASETSKRAFSTNYPTKS